MLKAIIQPLLVMRVSRRVIHPAMIVPTVLHPVMITVLRLPVPLIPGQVIAVAQILAAAVVIPVGDAENNFR